MNSKQAEGFLTSGLEPTTLKITEFRNEPNSWVSFGVIDSVDGFRVRETHNLAQEISNCNVNVPCILCDHRNRESSQALCCIQASNLCWPPNIKGYGDMGTWTDEDWMPLLLLLLLPPPPLLLLFSSSSSPASSPSSYSRNLNMVIRIEKSLIGIKCRTRMTGSF